MRVKKYRKKPVVIEAIQIEATEESAKAVARFMNIPYRPDVEPGTVHVYTEEGTMMASEGDYIIKGVAGEFYPCKPEIFAATYDPVDETRESPVPRTAPPTELPDVPED